MPVSTPEPRLPLEPEEYPLYKQPSRVGCSGLSIVALIAVVAFGLLFWQVTPRIVEGLGTISAPDLLGNDQSTPGAVSEGALATQTVISAVEATQTAGSATPTPTPQCVKVSGTGGTGTPLKAEPKSSADSVIKDKNGRALPVGEGAVFQIIGPDVTSGKDSAGRDIVWMHVILPGDGRSGYALGKYLVPTDCGK